MVPRDINEDARDYTHALMKAERYRDSCECMDKAWLTFLLRRLWMKEPQPKQFS
jgi:hypothetical protein